MAPVRFPLSPVYLVVSLNFTERAEIKLRPPVQLDSDALEA